MRTNAIRLGLLGLSLALTACGSQDPSGGPAPPPADAPGVAQNRAAMAADKAENTVMDLSQPMIAKGTEPFWAVRMEGKTFTLQRPDQPDVVFEHPGAQVTPGKAVLPAKSADGQTMTVTLYSSECSDGMSDLRYTMTAEVEIAGQMLNGCAAKLVVLQKGAAAAKKPA